MKISLMGYMGSGKTTIGKLLSDYMNLKFIDLDQYIEVAEHKAISKIFAESGEIYFRKIEKDYLHQVLAQNDFVLSTGGGTPAYYDNLQSINENSLSFYLQANPNNLAKRLSLSESRRPVIAHLTKEELPEFIAKHLFERNAYYQQATYTVNTNKKTEQEIVNEIREKIKYHQSLT